MDIVDTKYKIFIEKFGELRVRRDEPMVNHTHFKVGGPADLYFEPTSSGEFTQSVITCIKEKIPFIVLGAGANTIFADSGFGGIVIKNRFEEIKTVGLKGTIEENKPQASDVFVQAKSGTAMSRLARYTIDEGFAGLHFLISVPGTVGGGLKINAHFHPEKGQFIGNTLYQATLIDKEGNLKTVDRNYFHFGYDQSVLQKTNEIVVSAIFKLEQVDDKQKLWAVASEDIAYRNQSQPLGTPSSGCIFRNIDPADAARLATPNLTTSAGYLIDKAGLKGTQIGGVKISELHANYFLNTGNAQAIDVVKLMDFVKQTVKQKFNIELIPEVFLVGEF